jgi:hypothetical protein
MQDKFCVSQVKLTPLPVLTDELSEQVYRKCFFCEKDCLVIPMTKHYSEKLAGPDRYFCSFCLRKFFHTKISRNILVLSFRSIIGHFYYQNYLHAAAGRRMYLADIDDYIHSHVDVGLMNPVFDYDPDTFLWFVDFSRVGNSKKKLPLDDVLKTVVDILACFNLTENVPGVSSATFYAKYKEAITNFYERRYRPPDKRMLIPTLSGCLPGGDKTHERSRNFTASEMNTKK